MAGEALETSEVGLVRLGRRRRIEGYLVYTQGLEGPRIALLLDYRGRKQLACLLEKSRKEW